MIIYTCPICNSELREVIGNQLHPGDSNYGITLMCVAIYPTVCSAQEVMGHGNKAKDAFEVIGQKYKRNACIARSSVA